MSDPRSQAAALCVVRRDRGSGCPRGEGKRRTSGSDRGLFLSQVESSLLLSGAFTLRLSNEFVPTSFGVAITDVLYSTRNCDDGLGSNTAGAMKCELGAGFCEDPEPPQT